MNDLISDVFSTLKLRSQLYFETAFSGPFAVTIPEENKRIRFHLVMSGQCYVSLNDDKSIQISEGDLILIPHGVAQHLKSDPEKEPVSLMSILSSGALVDGKLVLGEGLPNCTLFCGFCEFDEAMQHPLFTQMPAFLHLRAQELGGDPWLHAALSITHMEAKLRGQGGTAILNRMIEILLVQTLREQPATTDEVDNGFIKALKDKSISRALRDFHQSPADPWRVESLANVAGMSRSNFSKKFHEIIGMAPMEYVRDWRLSRARHLLKESQSSIDEIADQCGYQSVPSFSRLFKKRFGEGPGQFRKK